MFRAVSVSRGSENRTTRHTNALADPRSQNRPGWPSNPSPVTVGTLQSSTGDVKGAILSGRKSIAILEGLVETNPDDAGYESRLMVALTSFRSSLLADGQIAEAIENVRRVVKTLELLSGDDPQNSNLRRGLGTSYGSLGTCLMQTKDIQGAIDNFRRSLSIAEELAAAEPKNADHRKDIEIAKKSMSEANSARRRKALKSGTFRPLSSLSFTSRRRPKMLSRPPRM